MKWFDLTRPHNIRQTVTNQESINTNNRRAVLRFSKLRLLGFKSFVDPTELIIANGLTGVVGPNGCGKSNLLEALRWVMGENRPKAMRGSGMEDVIFNGASSRPQRNHAEVTLTLENEDRTAPPGFNDADIIDVVRRITRDAGSAYKVLGKEARARDVQMLFADASTGAHSPALVRQGQISELVNAKPKARRRVLEEAAGISGLYQRRHEAELKLSGTELNLTRVDDVLEQLNAQLTSLAKQAKQAGRYRELSEDLRRLEVMLLYRRWAEARDAHGAAEAEMTQRTLDAGTAQKAAAAAATARLEAEKLVPPLRNQEAEKNATLARLNIERETLDGERDRALASIETLNNRLAQTKDDHDREIALDKDADETIERLEWEDKQLTDLSAGFDEKHTEAKEASDAAGAQLAQQETTLSQATERVAQLEARHAALKRRIEDARGFAERQTREVESARAAQSGAQEGLSEAAGVLTTAQEALAREAAALKAAEAELEAADGARDAAQTAESLARGTVSAAKGEFAAVSREMEALARLVARDRDEDEQVLNHISVDDGFERALGAALDEDLKAPMGQDGTGWVELAPLDDAPALPKGARAVASYVEAPGVLARRLATIGLVDHAEGDRLQGALKPGQRLVSLEGGMWRWDGYRIAPGDDSGAAAVVLEQRRNLVVLTDRAEVAKAEVTKAETAFDTAKTALATVVAAEAQARGARKTAESAHSEASRQAVRAEADIALLNDKIANFAHTIERRSEELTEAEATLASLTQEREGLDGLDEAQSALETARETVANLRTEAMAARGLVDALEREHKARCGRAQEVATELSGWRLRKDTAAERIAQFAERIATTKANLEQATSAPEEIAQKRARLADAIEEAEDEARVVRDKLAEAETALRKAEEGERGAERTASDAREARARSDAVREAAFEQLKSCVVNIREEAETTPEELLGAHGVDPETMPDATKIEIDLAKFRRQRDALGAVNLRAEEDAKAVHVEFDELNTEKLDLVAAVEKLKTGIDSLNSEGRARLLEAFDEVNKNFSQLFTHLFGGGDAKLVLVESDDPLEAGLEIMCQPPGKKLSTLSLLSGGEQTLTALSLIFAVFLANPSPICVLDEVDAPLDDANVTRFCDLLDEMTRKTDTRFLIITHHPVTMARMDRLFGVTMAEQGVSQLVSVDLQAAEKLVA